MQHILSLLSLLSLLSMLIFPGQVVFIVYAKGSKIDPVDVASAEPNFQSYNPQSIFILLECIIHN